MSVRSVVGLLDLASELNYEWHLLLLRVLEAHVYGCHGGLNAPTWQLQVPHDFLSTKSACISGSRWNHRFCTSDLKVVPL